MRVWVGVAVLLALAAAFAALPQQAYAFNVWDNATAWFGSGNFVNTTNTSGGLTIGNWSANEYYYSGGFTSRTFDAGQIANWSSYAANISAGSEHTYLILGSASNNSVTWTPYSSLSASVLMGRYFSYSVNLSSTNNQTRPTIDVINISYFNVPPTVTLDSPANGYATSNGNVTLNCSASSVNGMKNITFVVNNSANGGSNTTNVTGFANASSMSFSLLANGTYSWACLAWDNQTSSAWGANRTFTYQPDSNAPNITYNITPAVITEGGYAVISMFASDSTFNSAWMNLTYPNGTTARFPVANGGFVNLTSTLRGTHTVLFFANDSSGNTANVSASFSVFAPVAMNFTVAGNNASINSNITVYQAGTSNQIAFTSSVNGSYSERTLPNTTFDMEFSTFDGRVVFRLLSVDASLNVNKRVVVDRPSVSGMVSAFAANSSYTSTNATVRLYYTGANVSNEANLRMQKCADWSFQTSSCAGGWVDINSTVNAGSDFVEANITGFSAYGITQGSYCGDGTCNANEGPSNCTADCSCQNGQTRSCNVTHRGRCSMGTETCNNGAWAGCQSPIAETCNQIDDNCDGTVDNVNNGTSIDSTRCQCYGGGLPASESCDNTDNNCNGQVDESLTKQCGLNIGACRYGTSTCSYGNWSTPCTGGIQPEAEDCTNNVDDDCDGTVNNGCTNNVPCAVGAIPSEGCKCGDLVYTAGYCCGGEHQSDSCFRLPWELFIVIGVAAGLAGFFIHKTRKKNKDDEWTKLEKKYTQAPVQGEGYVGP